MNTNSMKWLLLLLAWMGLGTFLCKKYLCGGGTSSASTAASAAASIPAGLWKVSDGSFNAQSTDYYKFLKSKSAIIEPVGAEVDKLNTAVSEYIKSNGSKGLNVVGYYKEDEQNDNSFYANLGLARANEIKQKLVALGIPAKQISTSAQLLQDNFFNGETLTKGGDYSFFSIEDNSSKLSEMKSSIMVKPIILYFKVNSNELDLSADQQKQFADLIYYLDNVPDAKIEVAGHTDNDGKVPANMKLSEERANFVKNYLNTQGNIGSDKMNVAGYGPTKPIADNKTIEGKAQNRRVEVTLK